LFALGHGAVGKRSDLEKEHTCFFNLYVPKTILLTSSTQNCTLLENYATHVVGFELCELRVV
jgi:hypothetical protein